MSNAHKGHARHYKHIGWYIQTAALPVKTGIVILLWGEALRTPRFVFFNSSHICNTLFCMCICIYIYIYMCVFLHVASCSIACENRYCHSALGGGAAPLFLFGLGSYVDIA